MSLFSVRRQALMLIFVLAGCNAPTKRQPPPQSPPVMGRGTQAAPKPLAIERPLSPGRQPDDLDDRALLIPPPPAQVGASKLPAAAKPITDPQIEVVKATTVEAPSAVGGQAVDRVEKDEGLAALKRIHQSAAVAYTKLDTFEARLTRRETINGKASPQEVISFKFRKEPFSVRLKWIGQEGQGREVVYVHGQHGGKMHILTSRQDSFLPPMRVAYLPDDSTVRAKTRHDIREAGLSESIRQIGNVLDMIAKDPGQRGRLRYLGLVTRPEFGSKMDAIEETVLAKTESLLPQGGKRVTFFDTGADSMSKSLPVLVITHDAAGKEVEYYCFDRLMHPLTLGDADFDPEVVFKKK